MSTSTSHKRGSHHRGAHGGGGGDSHGGGGGGGGGDGGGGKLVKVAFARNQAEAELIQGLLTEAGIPSLLKRTRGFDAPEFAASGPHDVMVDSDIAQKARDLLAETAIESEGEFREEAAEERALSRPGATETSPARLALWVAVAFLGALIVVWILYQVS